MTLNYNRALFRTLHQPMQAGLRAVVEETEALIRGEHDGSSLKHLSDASNLAGSLAMIGCVALERLSRTLVEALKRIQDAPAYGWTEAHTREVSGRIGALAKGLLPQLEELAQHEGGYPVRLYPEWKALLEAMNEEVPSAEVLFEPAPDLDQMTFQRLDPEYLDKVVTAADARLKSATGMVRQAMDEAALNEGIQHASEVFLWAYNLFHRRGFQAYWLVLRARLAHAQLTLPDQLAHREKLLELLRDARVELKRFGTDAAKVTDGRVLHAMLPLLKRWPDQWQHPALAELRQAFALDSFWRALDDVQEPREAREHGRQFNDQRDDLVRLLADLQEGWEKWTDRTLSEADLGRRLNRFKQHQSVLPSAASQRLLGQLDELIQWCLLRPEEVPEADVSEEVATALLLLEDALDLRQLGQPELEDQLDREAKRVAALMVPGRPDYSRLPVLQWGNVRRRRETEHARRQSLKQIAKDLEETEYRLNEILREEIDPKAIRKVVDDLCTRLEVGGAALRLLKLPVHARLEQALMEQLDAVGSRPAALLKAEGHATLAVVLASLSQAILAAADGQEDTEEGLQEANRLMFNELPERRHTAPSLPEVASSDRESEGVDEVDAVELVPALSVTPVTDEVHDSPSSQPEMAIATPLVEVEAHEAEEEEASLSSAEGEEVLSNDHLSTGASVMVPETRPSAPVDLGDQLRSPEGYVERLPSENEDLVEIYFEEVASKLEEIKELRAALRRHPVDAESWESLRRAFHSIKGSGRLVGLRGLGELGYWGETYVRSFESQAAAYTEGNDKMVALLSQLISMAAEELKETGQTELHGQTLWRLLHAAPSEEEGGRVSGPSEGTDEEVESSEFRPEDYEMAIFEEDEVTSRKETEEVEVEKPSVRSALAEFLEDPSSRAALQAEWAQRREQLEQVIAGDGQDVDTLGLVAHTLRTLALTFKWSVWADEFALVERAVEPLRRSPENVKAWAERWLEFIHQAMQGSEPVIEVEEQDAAPAPEDHLEGVVDAVSSESLRSDEGVQDAVESGLTEVENETAVASETKVDSSSLLPEIATTPAEGAENSGTANKGGASLSAPSSEDAVWDEIFAAYEAMMEGGRRLGVALERLAEFQDTDHP